MSKLGQSHLRYMSFLKVVLQLQNSVNTSLERFMIHHYILYTSLFIIAIEIAIISTRIDWFRSKLHCNCFKQVDLLFETDLTAFLSIAMYVLFAPKTCVMSGLIADFSWWWKFVSKSLTLCPLLVERELFAKLTLEQILIDWNPIQLNDQKPYVIFQLNSWHFSLFLENCCFSRCL